MAEVEEKPVPKFALWGCGGCIGLLIVVVLLFAWLIARTGFVSVPVFSKAYNTPEPTRVVEPGPVVSDVADVLKDSLSISYAEKSANVALSDVMLTGLVRSLDGFVDEGDISFASAFDLSNAQVAALESGSLEIFVPFDIDELLGREDDGRESAITMEITPLITDGELGLEINRMRIGRLSLPVGLFDEKVDASLAGFLDNAFGDVKDSIQLQDIEISEGEIVISGALDMGMLR